jgi:hypothetical protein
LISSNSSTLWRASFAAGACVLTTIPSVTLVAQAIWSFGAFSISTRHIRQTPATGSPGW